MKKESLVLRLLLISFIILGLLIPLVMIQSLINERESYRNKAVSQVSKSWSQAQVFGAPVLTSLSETSEKTSSGQNYINVTRDHLLPEELSVDCRLFPEIRYRGIYEVVLYKSKIVAHGFFNVKKEGNPGGSNIKETYLSINLSDLRGIEDKIIFKWDGVEKPVSPGLKNSDIYKSGISVNLDKITEGKHSFDLELTLKGSEEISFIPVGKSTRVNVSSAWNNPSFTGNYLPSARSVSGSSFNAAWSVNYFNRSFPQEWQEEKYDVFKSNFGVGLIMPVDEYQKSMRTSKYGILIVLLTFVSFFMIEVFSKKVIHPVQYLLVGLSLVIFYSILVSLSEYILFHNAYIITSLLVILLIGLYVNSIYSSRKIAMQISVLLLIFYGFMYVIIQLQDYSLLIGNAALFIILAVIMYSTRKINWFEIFSREQKISSGTE